MVTVEEVEIEIPSDGDVVAGLGSGEHAIPAGDHADIERRDRVLARARELLSKRPTAEEEAEDEARRHRLRIARIMESPAPSQPAPELLAATPTDLTKERFVSLERADQLCKFAWKVVGFNRDVSGNGEPEVNGNCVGKARWLQRHLGGVLIVGFRSDRTDGGRHAALLFPIQGKLHVADWGEIIPVEEYTFYVEGFDP